MSKVQIFIPQIGEGLQEARLVAFLKKPGDYVRRDEPIYQMETDKAVMDVESPYEGTLDEWLAEVDSILAIGAPVATLTLASGEAPAATPPSHGAPAASTPAPSSSETNVASLTIPQIGEGLQEARLVAFLKQPGDSVRRDEPIYQMETDKAVMDVESPYEGTLLEWLAEVDAVLPIGAEVARMQVASGTVISAPTSHGPAPTASTSSAPTSTTPASNVPSGPIRTGNLPPKTRAYAKEKGISEEVLAAFVATGKKLPADLDAFLASQGAGATSAAKPAQAGSGVGGAYTEAQLSQKQRLLSSRLVRGTQLVVPGTISVQVKWEAIEAKRAKYKAAGGDFQPSSFTMFAFAVTKAMAEHPLFRSTLKGDDILRTYDHVNLGIAVALPGDELVVAVVDSADTRNWEDFAQTARKQIELARNGTDQANESVTVSLTNMQAFGLRDAVPVVVPPAVGTVFLGETYKAQDQASSEPKLATYVNISLTFDHRLINGVGAANFINAIKQNVEEIDKLIP